jgi:hypothetical protein
MPVSSSEGVGLGGGGVVPLESGLDGESVVPDSAGLGGCPVSVLVSRQRKVD